MRRAAAVAREEWTLEGPGSVGDVDRVDLWVAHALKNPLTAVKALVQLGLRNPAESASHERLALLEREVDRVEEIVASYLGAPSGRLR